MSAKLSSLQTLGIKWPVPPCQAHWPWLLRGVLLCDICSELEHDIVTCQASGLSQRVRALENTCERWAERRWRKAAIWWGRWKGYSPFCYPTTSLQGGLWAHCHSEEDSGGSSLFLSSLDSWVYQQSFRQQQQHEWMQLVFWLFIFKFGHLEILYCFPFSSRGLLI